MGNYEDMILDLKETVKEIEDSNTSLERMVYLYEHGSELITKCEKILADAEIKISELNENKP